MSLHSGVEWCDSSANPVMGCDGCELWNPSQNVRICYAGIAGEMRAGRPGYAPAFLQPTPFPGRMAAMARSRSLLGTKRPERPWLDGMPRVVFISDMGDALSKVIPFEFLFHELLADCALPPGRRHLYLWLTKQPGRMAEFSSWITEHMPWPANLAAGTSITGPETVGRARQLARVHGPTLRFLSVEPLWGRLPASVLDGIGWVAMGGQSGGGEAGYQTDIEHLREIAVQRWQRHGLRVFVKQLGSRPAVTPPPVGVANCGAVDDYDRLLHIRDRKGADPAEWPPDLRVREMPAWHVGADGAVAWGAQP